MKTGTRTAALALLAAVAVTVAGCGSSSSGGGGKLALVAYSTPQEAYAELIPAFNKTPAGKGVGFSQSYGASGDQSRAVVAGQPADVVALSLAPDVDKLVKAGLVSADWTATPTKGFVTDSVVALVVRKGNPKHIKTWADLIKGGIDVIEANPFESGGARWNIAAAYGAQLKDGKTPAQANAYVAQLFKHISVQDKSARDALQTFTGGKGDVLISYENEAIAAQQKGQAVDYVIPPETILIQNPVAVTKKASSKAAAFVSFLTTPAAQAIFAKHGYRPVISGVATGKFPTPAKLFDISFLGGWSKVNADLFDPDKGSIAKIEQGLGVSTAK